MARVHSKNVVIKLGDDDISQWVNASDLTDDIDIHDNTGYGADGHEYDPGLFNGSASMGGKYDSTEAGPRAIIVPLRGTKVTLIRQLEGTGTGKPQDSATVVVGKYVETAPVADFIAWTLDLTVDGVIDRTPQAS